MMTTRHPGAPPRSGPNRVLETVRARHVAATSIFLTGLVVSLGGAILWSALLQTTLHVTCGISGGEGGFVCPGGISLMLPLLELAIVAFPTTVLQLVLFFRMKSLNSWRAFTLAAVLPSATLAMAFAQHSNRMPLSAEFKLVMALEIAAIALTVFGASLNSLTMTQVILAAAFCCHAVATAVEPNILSAGALSMGALIAASLRRPEYAAPTSRFLGSRQ